MIDENNVKYLDCVNNVAHVGHCNEKIVSVVSKQLSGKCVFSNIKTTVYIAVVLNTNTRYLYDEHAQLIDELLSCLPQQYNDAFVFFVNSGSEANDLALRLARARLANHLNKSIFETKQEGVSDQLSSFFKPKCLFRLCVWKMVIMEMLKVQLIFLITNSTDKLDSKH